MKRYGWLVLMLVMVSLSSQAAKPDVRHALTYALGYGSSVGNDNEGKGMVYSVGYLYTFSNDRFRLNPSLGFGHYSAKNISDARNQSFNVTNLSMTAWIDVVQETDFSMMVGGGTLVSHAGGLIGADVDNGGGIADPQKYLNQTQLGGLFAIGFRFFHPDRRLNVELRPLNIHFGGVGFQEVYAQLALSVRL